MNASEQTFQAYVLQRRITDTPAGDFCADFQREFRLKRIDRSFDTWEQLERYLRNQRACYEAYDAAKKVWRAYRRRVGLKP